jgi:trigger factor
MNTSYKKLPKSQMEIMFEISAEEFKAFVDKATDSLGKGFLVEGFRQGKAPKELLEKSLPQAKVLEEAVDLAVKETYVAKVKEMAESKEDRIEVVGRPEIELLKFAQGSPLEFKATVSVMPEVVLPDYKKIASKIKPKEVEVTEKDLEESLKFLQKSRATTIPKDGGCDKGDFVGITFSAPQIEDNKAQQDNFVMGDGHFIPGFEEAILGMKLNEEKEFNLTFPEKYFKEELAGKEVNFKAKIDSVATLQMPELNDELAKVFGDFKDLEALKVSIKEGLTVEKKEEQKQRNRGEMLEKIEQEMKIDIPEVLIEVEKERMLQELRVNLQNQFKIGFEEYLKRINKTEKEIMDSFSVEAEKRVKNFIILKEIAEQEKIEITEKEIEDKVNEFLKQYPDAKTAESQLDLNRVKEYYKEVLSNEKVFNLLENL